MSKILAAFVALLSVTLLDFLLGKSGALRPLDERVLSRPAFFVAPLALMCLTVSTADLRSIFSPVLLTSAIGMIVVQVIFILVARLIWRREKRELTIGVLAPSETILLAD
jgi:hypothetical protein